MIFHAVTLGFSAYFLLFAQPTIPVEYVPVDAGVEDRGALSKSLRMVPKDMRLDQSFEKLYRVKGSKDVFIRKAGGLQAVFRSSTYVDVNGGSIAIVPAGTVYCIGGIRPELLQQLGVLMNPEAEGIEEEISEKKSRKPWNPRTPPPRHVPLSQSKSIKFLDDETYRRARLTSFVLEIVLSQE